MIRIILVDDHRIVREGIRALLEAELDMQVTGEADCGEALMDMLPARPCDLIFMDVSLPGASGIETTAMVTARHPDIRVIMLSMYNSEEFIFNSLKAGAKGYLPKNTTRQELAAAVHEVMDGGVYFGEPVSGIILRSYMRMAREMVEEKEKPGSLLTDRERIILKHYAEGLTNKQIAERLFISVRTVESHKNHIMRKLELKTPVDLLKFALRSGIVEM
ncbi:MAG TPA: response regulator transcription factor [Bacteroidales bacterium]|nr:response regulator transcription factor [Bacteroidales bacterium]HRZ76579.1 response regulator transcription factor [Bacteroidales bacterium]